VLLAALTAFCGTAAGGTAQVPTASDAALPETASGTFIQRKTLADVEVTITSTGTLRFEKGRLFEWRTLKPLPSTFTATPTNYAITVNGKTTTRRLKSNVDEIAKIFEIKEVKEFVKSVKSEPQVGFPNKVTVEFKNGDRLDIEMKR
jgi:hypothetical protein